MADVTMTGHERLVVDGLAPHARQHALHLLAACPGLRLVSGRRTPERNRAVGGHPRSFHLQGRAADFTGLPSVLDYGLRLAQQQRISSRCTGPEEALIHDAGSGQHLHVAW